MLLTDYSWSKELSSLSPTTRVKRPNLDIFGTSCQMTIMCRIRPFYFPRFSQNIIFRNTFMSANIVCCNKTRSGIFLNNFVFFVIWSFTSQFLYRHFKGSQIYGTHAWCEWSTPTQYQDHPTQQLNQVFSIPDENKQTKIVSKFGTK